jgi:hypothetical protein
MVAIARQKVSTDEGPPIRVTITRTRDCSIGYAAAASWDTDDTGREVRTTWTLVEDSHKNMSQQELSITDSDGATHSLVVAVASRRGENL